MNLIKPLLGLALLCVGMPAIAAANCTIKLKGDDRMQFDLKTVTVSAGCASINVVLTHSGKLPVNVMGHNVVISLTGDVNAVSSAGMKAGVIAAYVPKNLFNVSP